MKDDHINHNHNADCQCGCHDEHEAHHHEHNAISITTHDMSIVGSYKFTIQKTYEESEAILDQSLKQVAKNVTDIGGIIGHIKALISSQGKSCMISITEEESNKRYVNNPICTVEGVAIVFALQPEELETILRKASDIEAICF